MPKEEALRNLTIDMLKKDAKYYPAGALDEDECFYNAQIGDCGHECRCYLSGNCPIEEEIEA